MSALQDYEYEVKDKTSFFVKLLKKLKGKKNVLLLNPGKDERKNSTDLLWRVGGYKSNVFDKFDNLRNKNTIKNEPNGIILEVIGKENSKSSFEITSKKIEKIIIPKNIKLSKNQE